MATSPVQLKGASDQPRKSAEPMLSLSIDPLHYVSNLPEFHGDYRELQNFIDLLDKIQPILAKYDAFSQSVICDNIIAKLKGTAREMVEIHAQVTDWPQIRRILINNFGVKGSIEELFDELMCTRFKTNSAVFYSDIITALHKLNLKTKQTMDPLQAARDMESNKKSALTVFKNKLPEPMRSLLYGRKPTSLEEANDILHECGYAYYMPVKSSHNPFPYQHRPFSGPFNMCSTNSQNNSNVTAFGSTQSSNNEFQKEACGGLFNPWTSTGSKTSQNNSHLGLFGSKPNVDNNEFHKMTDRETPSAFGAPSNSMDKFWQNMDKNCTQNSRNLQQPICGPFNTNTGTFSIARPTDNLPFIVVRGENRPLKLIVDAEATHTVLDSWLCPSGCIESLQTPINVVIFNKFLQLTHKAVIPLFEELSSSEQKIECYISPLHSRFDGLLGKDVLLPLKCKIDLENNLLRVGNRVVELHFQDKQSEDADERKPDMKPAFNEA